MLPVQDVGYTAAHARGEVLAGHAQDHRAAAGHVLQAVVSAALRHRQRPGIPDAEALSGDAADIGFAGCGTVQGHVPEDDIVVGGVSRVIRRGDHQLSSGKPLSEAVIRIALQADRQSLRDKGSEGLSSAAGAFHRDRVLRQPVSVPPCDLAAQDGAEGAVDAGDLGLDPDLPGSAALLPAVLSLQTVQGRQQQLFVLGALQMEVIDLFRAEVGPLMRDIFPVQDPRKIRQTALRHRKDVLPLQAVRAAHHLLQRAEAKGSHDLPEFLRDKAHEVHDVLRLSLEPLSQGLVLGSNARRAGVLRADTHHHAAHADQRRGGKAEFLGPQHGGNSHVPAAHQLAVRLQDDPLPEAVLDKCLVCLTDSQLPGKSRVVDGGVRRRAGASVISADQDHLGPCLGHAGSNGPDTGLGGKLHGDPCIPVRVL